MITVLTGENDVLRQEALGHITSTFIAEHGDLNIERVDGEEASYERIHEAAQSLPFLADRKLVLLRAPGANKEFAEKFEQFMADIPETNTVVLVEPKLDKRLSYYKQLKKLTDFKEFAVLDARGLARYAADYAKAQGGKMSAADASLLVDRAGENQLVVQHELDKLLAYNLAVTRQTIELLVPQQPQNAMFDLLDAAFSGNASRAMKLYENQRELGDDPQKILPMLAWQLHILAIAKAATGRNPDAVAKEAKISPYTVKKSMALARNIGGSRLKQLITMLRSIDVRLKSEPLNADDALKLYLLQLAKR
jgi:DNA polymerase-3 subunit delta